MPFTSTHDRTNGNGKAAVVPTLHLAPVVTQLERLENGQQQMLLALQTLAGVLTQIAAQNVLARTVQDPGTGLWHEVQVAMEGDVATLTVAQEGTTVPHVQLHKLPDHVTGLYHAVTVVTEGAVKVLEIDPTGSTTP